MLAYGVAADATEEYHSLGENILMEAMKWFPIPYFLFLTLCTCTSQIVLTWKSR